MPTEIKLDCYGIVITLGDIDRVRQDEEGEPLYPKIRRYLSGSIQHAEEYEICPFCSKPNCCYQCDQSVADEMQDHANLSESEEEVADRLRCNGAIDAIMSMVVAHAVAGIDVTTLAYIEGIETAMDAAGNNS